MIYFEKTDAIQKYSIVDVIILKCKSTDNSTYWRVSVMPNNLFCKTDLLSVDTLDEAKIWCDLHNLNIFHITNEEKYTHIINQKEYFYIKT